MKQALRMLFFALLISPLSVAFALKPYSKINILANPAPIQFSHVLSNTHLRSIVAQCLHTMNLSISSYRAINVKLKQLTNKTYLLVYLHSQYFFIIHVLKINLNPEGELLSVETNYSPPEKPVSKQNPPTCPNINAEFLIANPYYKTNNDVDSADTAVDKIFAAAKKKYGEENVLTLLGKEDTVPAFGDALSCPNLKGIYSVAGHDDPGKSFYLYDDQLFYSQYFITNKNRLHLDNAGISFNTCYAYTNVTDGFCPTINTLPQKPSFYTAGITPLSMWGSPEAYACFWAGNGTNISGVIAGQPPTEDLLLQCAQQYDPVVKNSKSPLYVVAPINYNQHTIYPTTITTNIKKVYHIKALPFTEHTTIALASNEKVTQVTITNDDNNTINCTDDPTQGQLWKKLIGTLGLNASEFVLSYDKDPNTCTIHNLAADSALTRGHDIYGITPESCGKSPSNKHLDRT